MILRLQPDLSMSNQCQFRVGKRQFRAIGKQLGPKVGHKCMSESSGKANNRLALPKKGDGKGITQLICYFGDGFMAFKNSHELGHGTIAIDAFPRGLDIQKQAVSLRSAGPWGRL